MRKEIRWFLAGVATAFLVSVGWHLRDQAALRERIATLQAQRAARDSTIAALVRQAHPVDTVTMVRWFTHWDTVYAMYNLTDTARTHRQLLVADSTIHMCRATVLDCAAQVANRDTTITLLAADTLDLHRQLKAEQHLGRGFRILGIPFGCTIGYTASDKGVRPGLGCGIRFGNH